VITLRPGTDSRFSTNYFHETWHILSDFHGSRLLGRLLWGLAFQRNPGTVVLIDRPHLDPTPFEPEPASPILLVPEWLTPLRAGTVRALRGMLPLTAPPAGTVRWQTPGLDRRSRRPGRRRSPRTGRRCRTAVSTPASV
jgi:hypothetical protein